MDWNAFRKQHKGEGKSIKQLSSMYEQSKSGEYVFYKDKPKKKSLRSSGEYVFYTEPTKRKKKSLRSKKEDLPAYIESLPNELRLQVLSTLPIKDVLHSCQVSKEWERICKDDYLWKSLLVRDYGKFDDIQKTKFETYIYYNKYYQLWLWLKQYKKYKQIKFKDVSQLKALDLSSRKLTSIPKELGNLSKLKKLYLSFNRLTSIPEELGNLTQLQTLIFTNNNLTSVPKELGNLSKLTYLSLSSNNLTSVPKEWGNLSKLKELYLSVNQLTSVPKELGNLSQLKNLDLSFNKLTAIPEELGNLTQLKKFNIDANYFTFTMKKQLRKTFNYVSHLDI